MFSTHPPLVPRIQQIDRDFRGDFKGYFKVRQAIADRRAAARERHEQEKAQKSTLRTPMGQMLPAEIAEKFSIDPLLLLAAIGSPDRADVKRSQDLIRKLPTEVLEAAHHPYSARCVAFAMLVDDDHDYSDQQWAHLQKIEGEMTVATTRKLLFHIHGLELVLRLPLLEMIQGSLADLSPQQYEKFRATVQQLVKLDSKTSLFEFIVRHHLLMHLDRRFNFRQQPRVLYKKTAQVSREICLMLSAFTSASQIGSVLENDQEADPETTNRAYALALQAVEISGAGQGSAKPETWNVQQLESCMRSLHQASMKVKKKLLYAAAMLITYDHEITIAEAEFFRAVAESLDCPVPVLAAGRANPIAAISSLH